MSESGNLIAEKDETLFTKKGMNWFAIAGGAGAILTFVIVQMLPIAGLTSEGQGLLATLLAAVVLWITRPIPLAYSSLIFIIVPWILGYITPEVTFSGFSDPTFWLIFAVLGMASCIGASPLPKRLFLTVFSLTGKPTFKRVVGIGFALIFILGYFIPLSIAKAAITYAIIMPMVPLFGVPMKSRIGKSLAITFSLLAWGPMALTPTSHAMSSFAYGVLMEYGYKISFLKWASIAFFPTVIVFIGFYLFVILYSKPEADEAVGGHERILEELKALPAITPQEIWVLLVTLGIMAGWFAGLDTTLVALVGVILYVLPGIGVMSFSDLLAKGLDWQTLIMIGCFFAIGPMLGAVGLNETFESILLMPFNFVTTPLLFVLAIALLALIAWGLMIMTPAIPLVVPIILVAAPAAGVNPALGTMMLVLLTPQFFFWITPPTFALAMRDDIGSLKDWILYSAAFYVILLIVWGAWVLIQPVIGLAAP